MTEQPSDDTITCQVCGERVAGPAAGTAEGRDYAYFFCSEGCRQRWAANQRADRDAGERRD